MVTHFAREEQIGDGVAAEKNTGAGAGTHAHCSDADVVDGLTLRNGDGDPGLQPDAAGRFGRSAG